MKFLEKNVNSSFTVCEKHTDDFSCRIFKVVCKCFFNNQPKQANESVVKDRAPEFNSVKRTKD